MGARGLWGKQVLYEEAAKVPMILAGPDVPVGVRCDAGEPRRRLSHGDAMHGRRGAGSFRIFLLDKNHRNARCVSEYHASSSRAGEYMIRNGKWKYVYFVQYPDRPELFDLESDPEELNDLGTDKAFSNERERMPPQAARACSIPKRSTAKQSGDKRSSSPRTAAGRR